MKEGNISDLYLSFSDKKWSYHDRGTTITSQRPNFQGAIVIKARGIRNALLVITVKRVRER